MNKVTCKKEKGDIVIRIPINFLVSVLEEDRSDMTSLVVINKKKFVKEFCERLLEYDYSSGYNDYGLFYKLLDEVAEDIYTSGLDCVESVEDYYKKIKRKAVAK